MVKEAGDCPTMVKGSKSCPTMVKEVSDCPTMVEGSRWLSYHGGGKQVTVLSRWARSRWLSYHGGGSRWLSYHGGGKAGDCPTWWREVGGCSTMVEGSDCPIMVEGSR
ncbi:hypothetical protein Hamer_G030328 [Homarus americanus]|uniref:Uncharacterized protein n=1 Tax=Homarus americanus TaxID=6706 RepID=A0A8J5K5H5_HOMAM|nr:hypothetical protein Hamer_G030328 [Homarus americanus]